MRTRLAKQRAQQNSDKGKTTTTNRQCYENINDILRFPLDRVFTSVDTATPDSGERGSARRTGSRNLHESVRATKPARVLSKKIEREVQLRARHTKREALLLRLRGNHRPAAGRCVLGGFSTLSTARRGRIFCFATCTSRSDQVALRLGTRPAPLPMQRSRIKGLPPPSGSPGARRNGWQR